MAPARAMIVFEVNPAPLAIALEPMAPDGSIRRDRSRFAQVQGLAHIGRGEPRVALDLDHPHRMVLEVEQRGIERRRGWRWSTRRS
ncbi:hypothetical protein APX01_00995 [Cereibacter sphaeroides]|nr:hypothetical protein APX01_00995 [Cereibacter sphaeroides]ANS32873.1 hypothetical protein A3858_00995 [Cereibacter sphaeroides]ATN61925.1 hypothetical protein A3857_00995 [Cereibacter sphaeroides]